MTIHTHKCENCDWTGTLDTISLYIDDIRERVQVGEIMAAGQCPECDCLIGANDEDVPDYTLDQCAKIGAARDTGIVRELVDALRELLALNPHATGANKARAAFGEGAAMSAQGTQGPWTYTSDSCGYMLFLRGEPQGGARTMGTASRTSDGRLRHWKHRRADVALHAATAKQICDQRNKVQP